MVRHCCVVCCFLSVGDLGVFLRVVLRVRRWCFCSARWRFRIFDTTLQRAQQDTGNLLPGHGGILDRVDSYMLTAAPVYFFVKFCLPLIAALV